MYVQQFFDGPSGIMTIYTFKFLFWKIFHLQESFKKQYKEALFTVANIWKQLKCS